APVEVLLGRRLEEAEEARRVGSVAFDQVVGVDHVALRLAHLGAVLDDHTLREEVAERLVEPDEAQVAQHLGEEARVEEVEHGVLDATDVALDPLGAEPVVELGGLARRSVVPRRAVAREVPRGLDEGVHGRGRAPRAPPRCAPSRARSRAPRTRRNRRGGRVPPTPPPGSPGRGARPPAAPPPAPATRTRARTRNRADRAPAPP